jgi:ABC-type transport system involved in cytochrome c biogenesis permease subunit
MQFMALSIMIITILLNRRIAFIRPFGFILSGFTLLVSYLGEMNPQITPLMPVLQSPILSSHVSVIMISYALLSFMLLNGITSVILIRHYKRTHDEYIKNNVDLLTILSKVMLYPAVFLLAVGIFLGAIWANVSWGNYWSWDPKEVWALITLMVYSVPFHSNSIRFFRKPANFHLYLCLAFIMVLMTYFGVNYILGGMHSYAN